MSSLTVRVAAPTDAAAINRIYNHYVRNTTATFDTQPWSAQRRKAWLTELVDGGSYHIVVAELDGAIAGVAFNSPFRPKPAYRLSTETTVYAAPKKHARGIGTALYKDLFQRIETTDLHRAYAVIALPNPRSIALHQRFGFIQIATLNQVGHKLGRYVDVAWFEKKLK